MMLTRSVMDRRVYCGQPRSASPFERGRCVKPLRPDVGGDLGCGLLKIAAFLDATAHGTGALGGLLDHERGLTERARHWDRLVPARERAIRIAVAAVENLAAPGALLEDCPGFALDAAAIGARHPELGRLDHRHDRLALGIA